MAAGDGSSPASADTSASADALQPSSAPAWVPPRAVASQAPWEFALRAPERIATLPLAALGYAAMRTTRFVEQGQWINRFSGSASQAGRPRLGFSVGAAHLGPSVGLALAADFKPSALDHLFSAELAGSTRKYTRTLLAVRRGPATVHYEYDWRPRDRFFGYGLATSDDSVSSYAWRQQRYQLTLAYPWRTPLAARPWADATAWVASREVVIRRGRLAPSFEEVFPGQAGLVDLRQERLVYGAEVSRDRRAGEPHWGRGYLATVRAERFDRALSGLTIRSGHTTAPQFTRLSFKGSAGFSFMRDPRTIRIAVRAVSTGAVAGSAPLLIPDLVSLGADDGLASLDLGRFRDRDLLYGALTYIFPLGKHVEMELHAESGGVYPRMRDATTSSLQESYGFSLRPRTDTRLLAAIGADWSPGVFVIRYDFRGGE